MYRLRKVIYLQYAVTPSPHTTIQVFQSSSEAESKEKHGIWDPMPELTITSPYVHSRIDSNTFAMGSPMPESTLALCQSRLYPPVRDFGFGLGAIPMATLFVILIE
jgi:hypothetical protein